MVDMQSTEKDNLKTIRQLLYFTAEKYGDKPCILYVENGEIISKSFRQMRDDSLAVAAHLCRLLPAGAHITVIGQTSYPYLCALNAVMAGGFVAVPMDAKATSEDMAVLVKDSDSVAIVCSDEYVAAADDIARINGCSYTVVNYEQLALSHGQQDGTAVALLDEEPENCTLIMYTSGTTGDKKGVMLSNRNIVSNILFKEMSYEGENVALNVLPMHHIFCFSCDYLKNMLDGVTLCLNGDIANIYENMLRFRPTVVRMVPMVIEALVRKAQIKLKRGKSPRQAAAEVFGDRLTNIIASGAYFNPQLAQTLEEMGITVRQGYGMTETGPRIAVPNGKTDADSVGAVISICDVRISNGEIQVKSPSVMMGYYKKEAETAEVFTEDGWFRTGDMGRIAADRQLYVTGRLKNVIVLSNGENVSPEEIEKRFDNEPLIKEVLVYADGDKIAAAFYPDEDYIKAQGITDIHTEIEALVRKTNLYGGTDREIGTFTIRQTPLEKTSSGKIIRKAVKF